MLSGEKNYHRQPQYSSRRYSWQFAELTSPSSGLYWYSARVSAVIIKTLVFSRSRIIFRTRMSAKSCSKTTVRLFRVFFLPGSSPVLRRIVASQLHRIVLFSGYLSSHRWLSLFSFSPMITQPACSRIHNWTAYRSYTLYRQTSWGPRSGWIWLLNFLYF